MKKLRLFSALCLFILSLSPCLAQGVYIPPQNIEKGTSNGQATYWNSSAGKWVPATIATVLGFGTTGTASSTTYLRGDYAWSTITSYSLPDATTTVLGGVTVPTSGGLVVSAGAISESQPVTTIGTGLSLTSGTLTNTLTGMPSGTSGQTLYYGGSGWAATSGLSYTASNDGVLGLGFGIGYLDPVIHDDGSNWEFDGGSRTIGLTGGNITFTPYGGLYIDNAADFPPFTIQQVSGATQNALQTKNSSGSIQSSISASGLGTFNGEVINPTSTTAVGLTVSQPSGVTGDAFDVVTSTSAILDSISHTGFATLEGVTCPGSASGDEQYGVNALASGGDSLAIGLNANASGVASEALGGLASGYGSTSFSNATATGDFSSSLGYGDDVAAAFGMGFGRGITIGSADQASMAFGFNITTTAANQLVMGGDLDGSSAYGLNHGYFGNGIANSVPNDFTFQGTSGSGSNVAGANLFIASGQGTGTASSGNINFQVALPGSSGSSANSLATVGSFSGSTGVFSAGTIQATTGFTAPSGTSGASGTSGGGDTVSGGVITALGTGPSNATTTTTGVVSIPTSGGLTVSSGAISESQPVTTIGSGLTLTSGTIHETYPITAIGTGLALTGTTIYSTAASPPTGTADQTLFYSGTTLSATSAVETDGSANSYFGNGITNSSPSAFSLNATGGSGSNIAGASLNIDSGIGTGTGAGGNLNIKIAYPGSTGSSANSQTNVVTVLGTNSASSGTQALFSLTPVVKQTSTAAFTALLVNPTETSTGSGTHYLADFQVGGTSKSHIDDTGVATVPTIAQNTRFVSTSADTVSATDFLVECENGIAGSITETMPSPSTVTGRTFIIINQGGEYGDTTVSGTIRGYGSSLVMTGSEESLALVSDGTAYNVTSLSGINIVSGGATPSVATGTDTTATSFGTGSNDSSGTLVMTGALVGVAGSLCTVTFAVPKNSVPQAVSITPMTAAAAACQWYVTFSQSGFVLYNASATTTSASLNFCYTVVQ